MTPHRGGAGQAGRPPLPAGEAERWARAAPQQSAGVRGGTEGFWGDGAGGDASVMGRWVPGEPQRGQAGRRQGAGRGPAVPPVAVRGRSGPARPGRGGAEPGRGGRGLSLT